MARAVNKSSQCEKCKHCEITFKGNLEFIHCSLREKDYMFGQHIAECYEKENKK